MATKNKVTLSVDQPKHALTSAERRAARVKMISTKQAELKAEAAERRAQRVLRDEAGLK